MEVATPSLPTQAKAAAMMIHPNGVAIFVEVPKTGSTACTVHLNKKGHWFQNGSKGTKLIPDTFAGRHSVISDKSREMLTDMGVTVYGVVRNPWDRAASLWRASAPHSDTFMRYMTQGKFKHGPLDLMTEQQWTWLRNVDHVIRYEDLERTWDQMAYQFGHLAPGPLPKVNVSKRRAKPDWTREELDLVAHRWRDDIEHFGYTGPS